MKFLLFLIALLVQSFALEENEVCDLESGGRGLIRPAYQCAIVQNLIMNRKRNELDELSRGFISDLRVFCCPVRESVLACKMFGAGPILDQSARRKRIIGGTLARVAEFPYFAALGYKDEEKIKFECGGTLISEYFVLTAAHCCGFPHKAPTIVRLGKVKALNNFRKAPNLFVQFQTSMDLNDADDRFKETDIDIIVS